MATVKGNVIALQCGSGPWGIPPSRRGGRKDGKESRPQAWQRAKETSESCSAEADLAVPLTRWSDSRMDGKSTLLLFPAPVHGFGGCLIGYQVTVRGIPSLLMEYLLGSSVPLTSIGQGRPYAP